MRFRFILPLLGLCLLASCRRRTAVERIAIPRILRVLGGTTMSEPGKHYDSRAYRYQQGDRLAVVGIAEWPGKPAGTAFVVLYRLPNRDRPSFWVKSGSDQPGRSHLL